MASIDDTFRKVKDRLHDLSHQYLNTARKAIKQEKTPSTLNELVAQSINEFKDERTIHDETLKNLAEKANAVLDIPTQYFIDLAAKHINQMRESPMPVLAYGASFPAFVSSLHSFSIDAKFYCLEHNEVKGDYFSSHLSGIDELSKNSRVIHLPLVWSSSKSRNTWHEPKSPETLPDKFGLVIWDGPTDDNAGLIKNLEYLLHPGATILINGAHNPSGLHVVKKWRHNFDIKGIKFHGNKNLAVAELRYSPF